MIPGAHELRIRHEEDVNDCQVSKTDGHNVIKRVFTADHEYALKIEKDGYDQSDKYRGKTDLVFFRVWIEDSTTGEVVGETESVQFEILCSRIDRFFNSGKVLLFGLLLLL